MPDVISLPRSPCLQIGLPGGTGFGSGLVYALSGGFGKAAIAAGVLGAGGVLTTAHLYKTTDWLPPLLQRSAPVFSQRIDTAVLTNGSKSALRTGLDRVTTGARMEASWQLPVDG